MITVFHFFLSSLFLWVIPCWVQFIPPPKKKKNLRKSMLGRSSCDKHCQRMALERSMPPSENPYWTSQFHLNDSQENRIAMQILYVHFLMLVAISVNSSNISKNKFFTSKVLVLFVCLPRSKFPVDFPRCLNTYNTVNSVHVCPSTRLGQPKQHVLMIECRRINYKCSAPQYSYTLHCTTPSLTRMHSIN